MNPEILPSIEIQPAERTAELELPETEFSEQWVMAAYEKRFALLKTFKPSISLKTYYEISEKLKTEKNECLYLLNKNSERVQRRSRYTLLLDPAYFEQLFLPLP